MPETPVPDDVARFRAGDAAAFGDLWARCSPYLAAVAQPFAADRQDLADLLQQTWARIYERRKEFDGRGSLLGWMMTVCRRECLGRTRREKVRWAAEAAYVAGQEAGADPEPEPLSSAERRSVHAAVAALPPRQRDAVLLRILDGRSTRETAVLMGCAEGTVKALLHQGVQNLRERMGGAQ
ncbi:MAG TPA: sigma-70 family RNA polymerase sigma factor [Longimicrobiales bacterium]